MFISSDYSRSKTRDTKVLIEDTDDEANTWILWSLD